MIPRPRLVLAACLLLCAAGVAAACSVDAECNAARGGACVASRCVCAPGFRGAACELPALRERTTVIDAVAQLRRLVAERTPVGQTVGASAGAHRRLLEASGNRTLYDYTDSFRARQISDRFLAMDDNDDFHYLDYFMYLSYLMIPALVGALYSCCFPCFFIPIRYVCNGCGGRKPSRAICCCCTGEDTRFRGYSVRGVIILKVLILFITAGCVASWYVDYQYGTKAAGQAIVELADDIISVVQDIRDRVVTVVNALTALPYSQDFDAGPLLQLPDDFLDTLAKYKQDYVTKYVNDIFLYIALYFLLPLVLLLVGAILGVLNIKFLSLLCQTLIYFLLFVLWILVILFLVLGYSLDDACIMVDNGQTQEIIDAGTKFCTDNVGNFNQTITDALNKAQQAGCDALTSSNATRCRGSGNGFVDCGGDTCTRLDKIRFCENPASTASLCKTPKECGESCTDANLKSVAAEVANQTDIYDSYEDAYYNKVLPLLDCKFISDAADKVFSRICGDFRTGIQNITTCTTALGSGLLFGGLLLILGQKRFISREDATAGTVMPEKSLEDGGDDDRASDDNLSDDGMKGIVPGGSGSPPPYNEKSLGSLPADDPQAWEQSGVDDEYGTSDLQSD